MDGEGLRARRLRVSKDGDATKPFQVEQLKNAGMFDSDRDSEDDYTSLSRSLSRSLLNMPAFVNCHLKRLCRIAVFGDSRAASPSTLRHPHP